MSSARVSVDTSELKRPQQALRSVEAALELPVSTTLRQGGSGTAEGLLRLLRLTALASPTPQARLVAGAARVVLGEEIGIELGGGQGVGSRGSPSGELLWGSERGGANFAAPHTGGGYWIRPAVDRAQAVGADEYAKAIQALLHSTGLL